jgi:lipoic acid synthetase
MPMQTKRLRKPEWLRKKIAFGSHRAMDELLEKGRLHTICEEAMCPNISECFRARQATFLILGTRCTRACSFCNVSKGRPESVDSEEPVRVAEGVRRLGLRHVVITSPTRDDLDDGGAGHFRETVRAVKKVNPSATVELLMPDLQEKETALETVAMSGAEIIGHNVETVPRLYGVRRGAEYARSLRVLEKLARLNPALHTKSGIMLGLGEREEEVLEVMRDLLYAGCRYLSIGQYLAPSSGHAAVAEYVPPERFEAFYEKGMAMGFDHIKSSPYTRSSYMAHDYLGGRR